MAKAELSQVMNRINHILRNKTYGDCLNRIMEYEKDRKFCRHDMEHFLSVARIMLIKSQQEQRHLDQDLIYAVALLHDIGRVLQYETGMDHSKAGGELAKAILTQCLYREDEIQKISTAICAHNSVGDGNELSSLLRYADQLSRNCFICPAWEACHWEESRKNKGVIF